MNFAGRDIKAGAKITLTVPASGTIPADSWILRDGVVGDRNGTPGVLNVSLDAKSSARIRSSRYLEVRVDNPDGSWRSFSIMTPGKLGSVTDPYNPTNSQVSVTQARNHLNITVNTPAYLVIRNVTELATFTVNGKNYFVINDGVPLSRRTELYKTWMRLGYTMVRDSVSDANTPNLVRIGWPLTLGATITNGKIHLSANPDAIESEFSVTNLGLATNQVTAKFIRGNPSEKVYVSGIATPVSSTNTVTKTTQIGLLEQPAGSLRDAIETKIDLVETRVKDAITAMDGFRPYKTEGGSQGAGVLNDNLAELQLTIESKVKDAYSAMSELLERYAKSKDFIYNPGLLTNLTARLDRLSKLMNGGSNVRSIPEAFKAMLDRISGAVVNDQAKYTQMMEKANRDRILGIVNGIMALGFMVLGTTNGIVAYLPGVRVNYAAGEIGRFNVGVAYGAVYSQFLNAPGTITAMAFAERDYFKKLASGVPVDPQGAFNTLTEVNGPVQQALRNALIQFQIDVATNGPWPDNDPRIPAGKNSLHEDRRGLVRTLGEMRAGLRGASKNEWKAAAGFITAENLANLANAFPELSEPT